MRTGRSDHDPLTSDSTGRAASSSSRTPERLVGDDGRRGAPDDYVDDPLAREAAAPGPSTTCRTASASRSRCQMTSIWFSRDRLAGREVREADEAEDDLGTRDAADLWRHQKPLVEEDERAGVKLEGFPEEEVPKIMDALGDDAADPLQDFPNGRARQVRQRARAWGFPSATTDTICAWCVCRDRGGRSRSFTRLRARVAHEGS